MVFKLHHEIWVEMKQSDPGLRRNVVLWGLEVGGQWTMGRERGELSRQRQQHIQTPRAGWAHHLKELYSVLCHWSSWEPWGEQVSVVTRSQSCPAAMWTAPSRAVQPARREDEAESWWRPRFPTEDQDQAGEGKLEDSRRPLIAAPVGRAAGPEP